jgi:hypothetical protein
MDTRHLLAYGLIGLILVAVAAALVATRYRRRRMRRESNRPIDVGLK